jgi:hypothetical protein
MANTFKKIQTVTVGSGGAASMDFTSIPQTYTDLKVVVSARTTTAATRGGLLLELNGSSANFTSRAIYGEDNVAGSETTVRLGVVPAGNATASAFGSAEIYIPNYTSANFKSISTDIVFEQNSSSVYDLYMTATLWSNTAAITSLSLKPSADNWAQYTTATLYGVSNLPASEGGAKATGGVITADSSYFYHTFTYSGTFTPTQNLTADYLVIAGGGGGGSYRGGGGGAGGLRCTVGATGGGGSLESALSLTGSTGYTVTVGAGGAAGTGLNRGTSGSNSVFSTITSTGGGGGGCYDGTNDGISGGSGGGISRRDAGAGTAAAGTANQGFAGGTGGDGGGGGGGGAGAVGVNATRNATYTGANGGAGVTTSISGTSTAYAGGGGGGSGYDGGALGGTGGTGGGGNGASNISAIAGTAFRGAGGGGGGQSQSTGGAGGSGIVIVRYAR